MNRSDLADLRALLLRLYRQPDTPQTVRDNIAVVRSHTAQRLHDTRRPAAAVEAGER